MDYITYTERLNYLLDLIQKKRAGSPKELSEKFNCSEKTVRNMINNLRRRGYCVKFCKCEKRYVLR